MESLAASSPAAAMTRRELAALHARNIEAIERRITVIRDREPAGEHTVSRAVASLRQDLADEAELLARLRAGDYPYDIAPDDPDLKDALDAADLAYEAQRWHHDACFQCGHPSAPSWRGEPCPAGQRIAAEVAAAETAVSRALGAGDIPGGTRVAYHGSKTGAYGTYTAAACGCGDCGPGRYELRRPDGEAALEHVRRASITPISQDHSPLDGDTTANTTGGKQMTTEVTGETYTHGAWADWVNTTIEKLTQLEQALDAMAAQITADDGDQAQVAAIQGWQAQVEGVIASGRQMLSDVNATQVPVGEAVASAGGSANTPHKQYADEVSGSGSALDEVVPADLWDNKLAGR